MDNQAMVRTYGNIDLPEGTEEHSVITFAVFAYNQEKYIRKAVEGAFSQTYTPLEIILSDDCSGDRTFEIMEEMAKSYRGPNKVIVRQTDKNCGTLLHVVEVAKLSSGKLLVLAAGDDISKSQRTDILSEAWKGSNAWGLCSRFDYIDENGTVISRDENIGLFSSPDYPLRNYFDGRQNEVGIIHGATSAYDKRLFDFLETEQHDYILSEDGLLSILLNLLEKPIVTLEGSLVLYRQSEQSLTNPSKLSRQSYSITYRNERAIERFARSQANRCKLLIRMNATYGAFGAFRLNEVRLHDELINQTTRSIWWGLSYGKKVQYILGVRTIAELKYYLPRMVPEHWFIFLKTFLKKIYKF